MVADIAPLPCRGGKDYRFEYSDANGMHPARERTADGIVQPEGGRDLERLKFTRLSFHMVAKLDSEQLARNLQAWMGDRESVYAVRAR